MGFGRQGQVPLKKVWNVVEKGFSQLTAVQRVLVILLIVAGLGIALYQTGCTPTPNGAPPSAGSSDGYLFCFWNVENLFDDQDDNRTGPGDREYDEWLAHNPAALKAKLGKLTDALLKLDDGRGPDILAMVEVESVRAAELVKEALNARIADPSQHYRSVLMKEINAGRHIAPAILTRLPVVGDRTKKLGSRQRILEGRVVVDGQELIVIASHWTSRLQADGAKSRANYANKIYGAFHAMYQLGNPAVDVLVCGDFNDTPQDASVTGHLHAASDRQAVLTAKDPPKLFNLFAAKDPEAGFGTHYYKRWYIFDQIVVSPGLLDSAGWSCEPASAQTLSSLTRPGDKLRRPWRFGGQKDTEARGYSDHFPVTVRLKVRR
jgi:endonuclease/exonuclease/phosphatase family metal-dependent hydrolase